MKILYHDVITPCGQPADVVISALQKFIRRGCVEDAVRAAYELYLTNETMTDYLWERLRVISVEDIGVGEPMAPILVETLWNTSCRLTRDHLDYPLLFVHAVRYLCCCPKERGSSLLTSVTKRRIRTGKPFEIPDYVFDRHTIEGQNRGRGIDHFLKTAAVVYPHAQLGEEYDASEQRWAQELLTYMKEENEG